MEKGTAPQLVYQAPVIGHFHGVTASDGSYQPPGTDSDNDGDVFGGIFRWFDEGMGTGGAGRGLRRH